MKMTERQFLILRELSFQPEVWKRTMDVGGFDASWHSQTMQQCVRHGWAERKFGRYRITKAGTEAFKYQCAIRQEP